MNKDLYIALLEEHVNDLTTAMKIDTVLSLRKTEKIKGLKSELASESDWNKAQDELISKVADTAMDYQEDLNDLQTDMAADHAEYRKTLETIIERETRECNENVRLQGKIAELQDKIVELESNLQIDRTIAKNYSDEVTRLVKKNENLQEDLETAGKRITELEADKNGHRSVAKELKKEKYDMGMELEKLKKQNENLKKQNENLIEDIETSRKRLRTEVR